jgi:hypothetical protein
VFGLFSRPHVVVIGIDKNATRTAAMTYAGSGRTGRLARDSLRIILPRVLLERFQFHTQRLGVRDPVPPTELLDRFLHKLESGFVIGGSTGTEIPKVCAEENVGLLVVMRMA